MAESTLVIEDSNKNANEKKVEFKYAATCGICESVYETPKTLKCLHSFCQKCLSEKVNAGKNNVICPTCEEVTSLPSKGVEGLNTNYMLIEKQEREQFQKQVTEKDACIPCTSCDNDKENKATAWCRDCQDYMCDNAVKNHKEMRMAKHHDVISLEALQAEGIPRKIGTRKQRMCQKHSDEKLTFFCETCEVPFCRDCEVIDHPRGDKHAHVYLEDAVKKRFDEIQAEMEKCKQVAREVDNTIAQDKRVGSAHHKAIEQTMDAYDNASKQAHERVSDKLKEHRDKYSADLTAFDETRTGEIDRHKQNLITVRARISSALAVAEMLMESGSDYDMADMYKDIIAALRKLNKFRSAPESMSEVSFLTNNECLPFITRLPTPGTLEIPRPVEIPEPPPKPIWERKLEFGSNYLNAARGLAFSPSGNICVADYSKRSVEVFNSQGSLSKSIPQATASLSYPFDVAFTTDGYCNVNDLSSTVKRFTSAPFNYNTAWSVGAAAYGIAAFKNGTVQGSFAVCCTDSNLINIYDNSGSKTRSVSAMQPWFIDTTSAGHFVVSSKSQKSVQVVNVNGQLIRTIGPPPNITNTFWFPHGLCCNKDDEIFIANRGIIAMGIYKFKLSGEYIDRVMADINNPWGLTVSADGTRLAVVDQDGKSVKVFGLK